MREMITIKFNRVKFTTAHYHKHRLWCEDCQAQAEFLNQPEASEIAKRLRACGLSLTKESLHFYRLITQRQILVCLNSI
jgi:hypothetical protein